VVAYKRIAYASAYVTSKVALIHFSENLALEPKPMVFTSLPFVPGWCARRWRKSYSTPVRNGYPGIAPTLMLDKQSQ
jgi:hypothetical protein